MTDDTEPMTRLQILTSSLARKKAKFDSLLTQHFDAVAEANGQPLNDKRNGKATLTRWEKQNAALRTLNESIERTKNAIERENSAIARASSVELPQAIASRIENGLLSQWRKHPNTFFVVGVDKARIVLLEDGRVAHRYVASITDAEKRRIFARAFNDLSAELRHAGERND